MPFFGLRSSLLLLQSITASAQVAPPSYAPTSVACPAGLQIRNPAEGLSSQEKSWREIRFTEVLKALPEYLQTANIPGFDVNAYICGLNASHVPISGLAISGGGSQSGMTGLGVWQAFDSRYEPAVQAGTGGLAQCLTYFTGLSGGGLNTVLPIAANNFSSVWELRQVGNLTQNYVTGPENQTDYFEQIFERMGTKARAGFRVGAADVLGQWFAQYLPPSWRYKTVSALAEPGLALAAGMGPLPITLLSEVIPGSSPEVGRIMYPNVSNPTIYEQTPFEFGSWAGGRVQGFIPTKFLGSEMINGKPANQSHCVNGFDSITFAQGSTGNAWNLWLIDDFYSVGLFWKRALFGKRQTSALQTDIPIPSSKRDSPDVQIVNQTANIFHETNNQTLWATYPNPFNNYTTSMANVLELLVVDGSENSETIPLRPLVIPERQVDFIIAYDSSGEEPANSWVNGTTFGRNARAAKDLGFPFPEVPDATTFVNLELNKYPTFFGCNDSLDIPLVLYLPNAPWSAYSNYSFRTPEFTDNQLDLIFNNSLDMVTMGRRQQAAAGESSQTSPPFSTCIACGLLRKSLLSMGQSLPEACETCFQRHCWNGTVADSPKDPYSPALILNPDVSYELWNATVWY